MAILADIFPKSRLVPQKHMGIDASFTKFVLCLRCLKRYLFKDSWHHIGSTLLFIIPGELPVMLFCSSLLNCVLVGRCCILIKSIVTSLSLLLLSSDLFTTATIGTTGQVAGLSGIFMMVKY